jgi:hypothetical protein
MIAVGESVIRERRRQDG